MASTHPSEHLICDRYQIQDILGQGGTGITYRAVDFTTGQVVALKALSLKGLDTWKKLDLFEREAQILATLNHPAIPQYIDYFQVDTEDDRLFYLVQDLAPGQSLAQRVETGWRVSEAEVRQIGLAVLDVLTYLHGLNPPIIHRDIKPQNIIQREDGHLYLVDFGAVQAVYRDTVSHGSTIVGTYGYMAPEQFRGQASAATDLYGLGATLIYLLTHQAPNELPQQRLKIDFRPSVTVSPEFAAWLDRLIEPVLEDRFASASEALRAANPTATENLVQSSEPSTPLLRQPLNSRVQLEQSHDPSGNRGANRMRITIPPKGFRGEAAAVGCFSLFWLGFVSIWTLIAIKTSAPFIFMLFSVPFWMIGLTMVGGVIFWLVGSTQLEINPETFALTWQFWRWSHTVQGWTADLDQIALQVQPSSHQSDRPPNYVIALHEGDTCHTFGSILSQREQEWLVQHLNQYLNQVRAGTAQHQ